MRYFYRFLLVLFLSSMLGLFVYGFLALNRLHLIEAIVRAFSRHGPALQEFANLVAQGEIEPLPNWQLWGVEADPRPWAQRLQEGRWQENRIHEFMLTLDLYWILLKQRAWSFLPILLLSLPLIGLLFYCLRIKRLIQQDYLVYTSPLQKGIYVYALGASSWLWMFLFALPYPLSLTYIGGSYLLVVVLTYKVRQIVQVSVRQNALTVN